MPEPGTLARKLVDKLSESEEVRLALGLAEVATEEVKKLLEDLMTLTVRTVAGEDESKGKVEISTHWTVDGDVETTILPHVAAITKEIADFHMAQFREALNYRLRLTEAILRLSKIDVHLL